MRMPSGFCCPVSAAPDTMKDRDHRIPQSRWAQPLVPIRLHFQGYGGASSRATGVYRSARGVAPGTASVTISHR